MIVQSQLVKILKKLSDKEQKKLLALAHSGWLHPKPEVHTLLAHICTSIQKQNALALQEELCWAAMFPKTPYSNKNLRYFVSYALDAVRQYLRMDALNQEAVQQSILLQKALKQRNLTDILEKESKAACQLHEVYSQHDAQWHLESYQLKQLALEQTTAHQDRQQASDLTDLELQLSAYFCAEYLRTATVSLSQGSILAEKTKPVLLDHTLRIAIDAQLLHTSPAVTIYYYLVYMFIEPAQIQHFQAWKLALGEQSKHLSQTEQRGIYLTGINYCIKLMNSGQRNFIREAFALYQQALEADLLRENGWITAYTYKNIIRIGTALHENDWVATFFESQKQHLHPREREETYQYNKAFLLFQAKQYDQAMPLLQRTNITDVLNKLDARRMLMRTYFELEEWQALESLMVSFSNYLRRQKNLGYHREMYLNFIFCLRQMLHLSSLSAPELLHLTETVHAMNPVAEKEWLLSTLEAKIAQ
jgi:hypothetical protein